MNLPIYLEYRIISDINNIIKNISNYIFLQRCGLFEYKKKMDVFLIHDVH